MNPQTRRAMRRMKSHRRRMEWRADARVLRLLSAVLARLDENNTRLSAIEARGTPAQWRQAWRDLLDIRSDTGQTASVARINTEQIHALIEAFTRMSVTNAQLAEAVSRHDTRSATERSEIKDLMSANQLMLGPIAAMMRSVMRHMNDIGRAVGADQMEAELRRLKDVPPEKK